MAPISAPAWSHITVAALHCRVSREIDSLKGRSSLVPPMATRVRLDHPFGMYPSGTLRFGSVGWLGPTLFSLTSQPFGCGLKKKVHSLHDVRVYSTKAMISGSHEPKQFYFFGIMTCHCLFILF